LPNLDIIAPLTMGQINELSVCDNIDIKLLKSYISVVDNCELALQVINPKGVELEIMS